MKVISFITREKLGKKELLLVQHQNGDVQFPEGTIDTKESPGEGALRAAYETTGLSYFEKTNYIGYQNIDTTEQSDIEQESVDSLKRYYYHLVTQGDTKDQFEREVEQDLYKMFWAPIDELPNISNTQDEHLLYVKIVLNYTF